MDTIERIRAFAPRCEQEETDRRLMLRYADIFDDLLFRSNELAHFTASAWVVNPARDKALMLFHNIYNSWSWSGGHADGEDDLLSVALREVAEETGLVAEPVTRKLFSLEILPVSAHIKRGRYVAPHLHLNLTFLVQADDSAPTRRKADENSAVKWFGLEEAVEASTEADMRVIYRKLNERLTAQYGAIRKSPVCGE